MAKTNRQAESSPGHGLFAVHGADGLLVREAITALLQKLLGPNPDPMAVVTFDGDEARLAEVLDEVRTPGLLAPQRVVVLRKADPFITEHRKALEQFARETTPGSLVLLPRKWPSNWTIVKLIEAQGRNIECPEMKAAQLPAWITARARSHHRVSIESAAAQRLADLAGRSLDGLDNELEKLATFIAPADRIERGHVEALVGSQREELIFAVGDALARRDAGAALRHWRQVLAVDRAAPYRSMAGLAWSWRRWVEARQLLDSGESAGAVVAKLRLFIDPPSLQRQMGGFTLRQLETWLVELLRADLLVKTGLTTTESAIDRLIVRICQAA